jgi:hypothetical protein
VGGARCGSHPDSIISFHAAKITQPREILFVSYRVFPNNLKIFDRWLAIVGCGSLASDARKTIKIDV